MLESKPQGNQPPGTLPRPIAAVMSSGFFGFFAHAGFLAGLEDLGIAPDCYAGTSSGGLAAAFAAGGLSPAEMLRKFLSLRKQDFWDRPGLKEGLRFITSLGRNRDGYLEGERFQRLLERSLPVSNFEQCLKPCLVTSLDIDRGRRVEHLRGELAPALRASGCVPMLFQSLDSPAGRLVDGGLIDKAPLISVCRHFKPATIIVHYLESSELGRPYRAGDSRLSPVRLYARSFAAVRRQVYEDQKDFAAGQGVRLLEVMGRGLPKAGPDRLGQGEEAYNAARNYTTTILVAL